MNTKAVVILLIVTVVIGGLAAFALVRSGQTGVNDPPVRVLPALANRINDVAGISLRKGAESLTITRRGQQWVVDDLGGYPATFESVKELIVAASELKALEPKTRTPELYSRLGVEDPGENAASTLLTFTDADGGALASIIVGNQGPAGAGGSAAAMSLFVRVPGDAQSWLAQGRLTTSTDPMTWVTRDVISLDNSRVHSATITHADGEQVVLSRAAAEVANFSLADAPPDRPLRPAGTINASAQALSFISAENIKTAAEFEWDGAEVVTAEYRTFDGLLLTVRSMQVDEVWWINITASATQPLEGQPAAEGDVTQEASDLHARLSPWAFAVSSFKAEQMRRRMKDMLQPSAPPTSDTPAQPAVELTQPPSMFGPTGGG